METNRVIKEKIKKKFKRISRFCKIIGRDEIEVRNILKRVESEAGQELSRICDATPDRVLENELTPADIKKVRDVVSKKFHGNVSQFSREAGMLQVEVFKLINGSMVYRNGNALKIIEAAKLLA